jgi:Contractile injection system tube protein
MAHSSLTQPKRGYLANITILPPLIYPFQYNPTQLTDSKKLEWATKEPTYKTRGLEGLAAGITADVAAFRAGGFKSGVGKTFGTATEVLGRTFSAAELKQFKAEGPRTLNFRFMIDGREQRPGDTSRRRNEDGHILNDLAVIRSFVYPQFASDLDILAAIGGTKDKNIWSNLWFNHPPTMTLIMGDLSCEGFVEELKITETLFNDDLDPVRAEIEITLQEKIDSISFAIGSIKRLGRMMGQTAVEDIRDVLF